MTFYPSLVRLVGDHATAIVLSLIIQESPNVQRKGVYWLAKPRSAMCAEAGVTLDQYKRILPSLVKQGLIVAGRGLFQGKVTPFIRLTEKGAKATNGLVAPCTNHIDHIDMIDPLKHRSIKRIEVNVSNQGTNKKCISNESRFIRGGASPTEKTAEGEGQEQDQEQGKDHYSLICQEGKKTGWLMKASEILNNHKAPLNGGLGAYWKSRMKMLQGGYQKPLSIKELSQLKQLGKYLGEQTKPVIDYAVNHWWKFASKAAALAGVDMPAGPHIGFLLQHCAVAVDLLTAGGVSVPAVPVEVSVCPSAPPITAEVPAPKLTSKELAELLDDLNSP